MDRMNYSKCPLKKRPIYIIKEEDEIEDGPLDLSVKKWHNKFKYNTQIYKEPSTTQIAINYSTKLETIKEENYLNNYDYDKLQNISTSYTSNEPYQYRISIENNENMPEYNQNYSNNERNFNNNLIKNDLNYNNQQYYNDSLPITKTYQPLDLRLQNNANILTERLVNIPRKDFHDKMKNELYFKCNICNKCYSTNSGLIKHQQCHANRHPLEKIENLENLNRNIENNHHILNNNNSQKLINIQRYHCKDCNKSYSTFSGLTKHEQFHCPNSEQNQVKKIFSCKNCDKVYVSLGALKMHIRTHTLPCKCPLCGKAFSRPWLLQGHIRTHTGEKPFSCQHCNRAFADRSNLRAHLQTHSDIKKYSCTSCTKTFSRMSLLAKHLQGGCQSGTIAVKDEISQNGSTTNYHNGDDDDDDDNSLYDTKNNPSVIVQNSFYGNLENGEQFSYPIDNY